MKKVFLALCLAGCMFGKEISVIAVGDIMLGSNYPEKNLLPKNDTNILLGTEKILKDADITVGNLEGTLFDSGGNPKKCSNPKACYVFRTPAKYGNYLKSAGFDFLSLANNHSNDFGDYGRKATMENLKKLGIKYAGLKNIVEIAYLEKDGIKYSFLAFAPNVGTVSINNISYAQSLVKKAKKESDIVIVMFHGGAEGAKYQHVTGETEYFYGENRGNVKQFSRALIDAGADLIFGQGPHVVRAVELYKNKFISYSAGNFATYGKINVMGVNGLAPIFKIYVNEKGDFVKGHIYSAKQNKIKFGPFLDANNEAAKKIKELSDNDFPQGYGLVIKDNGEITKNN